MTDSTSLQSLAADLDKAHAGIMELNKRIITLEAELLVWQGRFDDKDALCNRLSVERDHAYAERTEIETHIRSLAALCVEALARLPRRPDLPDSLEVLNTNGHAGAPA